MKISSGAKISKGTLKRSVRAAKGQSILRGASKDSSKQGVYVSLSYAPGSGKPQTNTESEGQFIYVTIHNIPRFSGNSELFNISPQANLYYRIEPGGKTYEHPIGNGEFGIHIQQKYANSFAGITDNKRQYIMELQRYAPDFIHQPYSRLGDNFVRPWVFVESNGRYMHGYSFRSKAAPNKGTLYHPKLVSQDPVAALNGTGVYMRGHSDINSSLEYKWVQSENYVTITYPIGIYMNQLPDMGTIGLTDIQINANYREFYEGPLLGASDILDFQHKYYFGFNDPVDLQYTFTNLSKRFDQCTPIKINSGTYSVIGQNTSSKARNNLIHDPWASINELPLYGDGYYPLRPAQREFYPWAYRGYTIAQNSVKYTNTPNTPPADSEEASIYWPPLSRPKLILSEDGTKVEKSTIGSWWSKDPKYGRSIGYRHELQVKDSQGPGSWRTVIKQNENFTKSNIKSENLQPVTDHKVSGMELDKDYLNYFFQIPTEIKIDEYLAIRSKITAKLEIDGVAHYAYMFSEPVYAPQPESSALGYYYYGGEGFEGIGVSNL